MFVISTLLTQPIQWIIRDDRKSATQVALPTELGSLLARNMPVSDEKMSVAILVSYSCNAD